MATQKLTNVDGYLHKVSEVKNSASGVRYFDFEVQETDDKRRVVCFSPDKRQDIKEKEEAKSPVRLLNVSQQKREFEPDAMEYNVTPQTKVLVTRNLSFPWKDQSEPSIEMTVREILDETLTGDIVSVRAIVAWKGETETVYSRNLRRDVRKCDLILADDTGAICATIWEEQIAKVANQNSYVWSKMKVGFFKKKSLSAAKDSTVVECAEVWLSRESEAAIELLILKEKEPKDVIGHVVAVDITKYCVCMNCRSRVSGDGTGDFVDCPNCKLRMLKENLVETASGSVMIMSGDDEDFGRLRCEAPVLNAMMESISQADNYNISETDVAKLSRSMIADTLLLVKKVLFRILPDDKLILNMSVV